MKICSGTAGRNLLLSPGEVNWNISAFKEFVVFESQKLQFRAEVFNVFNAVNFGNLTAPSAARISVRSHRPVPPRILQFGLKYLF